MTSKGTEYFLRVISAEGLETKKPPNTLVEIRLGYQKSRTEVVKKCSRPVWNEDFRMVAQSPSSVLSLKVMRRSALLPVLSFLCGTEMEIGRIMQAFERNQESELYFPLRDEKGAVRGQIKISCSVGSSYDVVADYAIMPAPDPTTNVERDTTELVGYDVDDETAAFSPQSDIPNAPGLTSNVNGPHRSTSIGGGTTAIAGYDIGEDTAEFPPQMSSLNASGLRNDAKEARNMGTDCHLDAAPADPKKPESYRLILGWAWPDGSVAFKSPVTLTDFTICQGDAVIVRGKGHLRTILTHISPDDVEDGRIEMNKVACNNLRVKLGTFGYLYYSFGEMKYCQYFCILPVYDSIEVLNENFFDLYLRPYFSSTICPIGQGETFLVRHGIRSVEFKVIETHLSEKCLVIDSTVLDTAGEPINRNNEKALNLVDVGYNDIGVSRKQLAQIRDYVELPLCYPELFTSVGVKPPRGILLVGPSGSGQRLVVQAVAHKACAFVFEIDLWDILDYMANLTALFQDVKNLSPLIIFIDEIDHIAPKREMAESERARLVTPLLIMLMDGLKNRLDVVVIAAATSPNSIDPALRQFGRFEREIVIGIPNTLERLAIIRTFTKDLKLGEDVDLRDIAAKTHGFVRSDITSLCTEAAMQQIRKKVDIIYKADAIEFDSYQTTMGDFRCALDASCPSSRREAMVQSPTDIRDDINLGGLEEVRRDIREIVQFPVSHPEKYLKYGALPSRGVLLYGPPGTAKSLLVKAIADDCNTNIIHVESRGFFKTTRGVSEAIVRDIFDKAYASAPCIIFFDNLDFIAKTQGCFWGDAPDCVSSQILAEMDCMCSRKNMTVFIIGATNRPDQIDPAFLRPGRLSQMVYVPLPDKLSRVSILRTILMQSPVAPDVDLYDLAEHTNGFSGADLRLICQRAVTLATKDSVDYDEATACGVKSEQDPVPMIIREHFENAMKHARCSVSYQDFLCCELFAQNYGLKS